MSESSSRPMISPRLALRLFRALSSALFLLVHLPAANGQAQDHSTDALRKFNESVDALIRRVSPSVVQILVTGYGPLEEGEHGNTNTLIGRQRAIGSGFVIDPSGYIVTNAHVVSGTASHAITKPDGTTMHADVIFFDPERDVAVLYVPGFKAAGVTFGPAGRGTQGAVIGYPGGQSEKTVPAMVSRIAAVASSPVRSQRAMFPAPTSVTVVTT